MSYKKISKKIQYLENEFQKALDNFKNDDIFNNSNRIYLKKDKKNLHLKWKKVASIFKNLKFLINSHSFNFLIKRNYNSFIIKYYCIVIYYNMTLSIQEVFKEHEDFIRQYLDENYNENYSTIARYIYKAKFLYYLNYPKKFLRLIQDKIDNDLLWMMEKEINYTLKLDFEYKNFYYYFKFRIDTILHFIVKYFGLLLSHIRVKISEKGLINESFTDDFYKVSLPGDILLTRQTFVATNIGIPGFWKHMAMYLGTGEYLQNNFNIEKFKNLEKNTHYIIESTGKGVTIEKFENFIHKLDYLGVFRTTFSEKKIKNAIYETSKMLDKNYDYLFNYYSDASFVCSELITKAYLKEHDTDEGLTIELQKIVTGLTYPPNDLVKKAENEKNSKQKEIIPILFIDSLQQTKTSFIGSNEMLLESHKRGRFSFFLK